MLKRNVLTLLVTLTLISSGALAQQAAGPNGPDLNQAKAESVFKHVPADAVAVVATPNFKELIAATETMTKAMGVAQMLQAFMPGGMMQMVTGNLGLGKGYNPNGGVALVVADFAKSGIDIDKIDENPNIKPPIILLVAGKDVQKAFPAFARKNEDGKVVVNLPGMVMQTKQVGGYIALSPNAKSLAMVGKKSAKIGETHLTMLNKNNLGFYFDFAKLTPLMEKGMKKWEAAMGGEEGGPQAAMLMPQMAMFKDSMAQLKQLDAMTMGLRMTAKGVVVDLAADAKAGTALAKQAAATPTTSKLMLNRLPNLPYVLAAGQALPGKDNAAAIEQMLVQLDRLLAMSELKMPKALRKDAANLLKAFSKQVTGVQMVIGGPKDKGLFGMGFVLECKDASKVMTLLPKEAKIITEFVQKTIGSTEEDAADFAFKYVKGVKVVAGVKVDAMEISHPEMATMEKDEKAEMAKVLGEDKIRLLVAPVDKKTVVISFGGGTSFLAEAIKAARTGGKIDTQTGVVAVRKMLPKKLNSVILLSPTNLFQLIQDGMKKMGVPSDLPSEFKFAGTKPIAMGATVVGKTQLMTLYIPMSVLKDVQTWIMMEMASKQPAGEPEGGDF